MYAANNALTQADVSRGLARIAWGVVTGECTPKGAVRIAAKLWGSTARAAAIEHALSKETAGTSDELKATRVYRALASGVEPAPYAHSRDDAPPGKERPLGAVLREVDSNALREWVALRDQAEREGKTPLQVVDDVDHEAQRSRLSLAVSCSRSRKASPRTSQPASNELNPTSATCCASHTTAPRSP